MKKIIMIAAACVLAGATTVSAQRTVQLLGATNNDAVKVLSYQSARVGDRVNFDFVLNYDKLLLDRNEELVIIPYVVNMRDTIKMRPIVFMGENYYNKHSRRDMLYGQNAGESTPYETVVFTNQEMRERRRELRRTDGEVELTRENNINYSTSFPYQAWMDGADVALNHNLDGYRGQSYTYNTELGVLYNPLPPQVMYIVPEVETVKARQDHMTAHVNFQVNKTEIRRDLFNNATELDEIYRFTDNVMKNEDVNVTGVKLKGYASPEGTYKHNNDLAERRVESLRHTLSNRYNVDPSIVTIEHVAEDWDSVARWVASSDLRFKDEVLNIIRTTSDPDARDSKIRNLDRGTTYNTIFTEVYPGLRRVDYSIDYTVMPFTVDKGRQVMRTNPQHLSLNEYYQVALSYPVDSHEYGEAFSTAVRHFPNDEVANHNMAAVALSRGDYEAARRHMEKCKNHPQALNNLGILYVIDGDYNAAEDTFKKAMSGGSKEAAYNYQNLNSISFKKKHEMRNKDR